jgi:lipopolysaccharide export system protein LptC
MARSLEQQGGGSPVAPPMAGSAGDTRRPRAVGDAYSRRVALLKRLLPMIGLALLLLVAAWPRLEPLLYSVRFGLPIIDRRDARELQMTDPRYAGVDRLNRPYVLTAAAGRKMPGGNDLMSLDHPRGQLLAHAGMTVVLTAVAGIYQPQARLLDLFGDVTLTRQDGTRFVTPSAHVDFSAETARGQEPVAGHGPSGSIAAQGFRILNRGDTIVFTGRSHLLLERISAGRPAPPPPGLPPRIAKAAAEIASAASAAKTPNAIGKVNPGTIAHHPARQTPAGNGTGRENANAAAAKVRGHGG